MKKILILTACLTAAAVSQGRAQHFIASFGIERTWNVPEYVSEVVYTNYWNYDWVHATRVVHNGVLSFNVLLQRGNTFIAVNIGPYGHYRTVGRYNYYPLTGHICNEFCGYHDYYYHTYYTVCHSHNHFGHNHIVYRPRPVTYVYGGYRTLPAYRRPARTVIIKDTPHKGNVQREYRDARRQHTYREPSYNKTARTDTRVDSQKRTTASRISTAPTHSAPADTRTRREVHEQRSSNVSSARGSSRTSSRSTQSTQQKKPVKRVEKSGRRTGDH